MEPTQKEKDLQDSIDTLQAWFDDMVRAKDFWRASAKDWQRIADEQAAVIRRMTDDGKLTK